MRRPVGFALLLLALGCGINVGTAPARRVFPNPPSLGALADVPDARTPAAPPTCGSVLGFTVDPTDVEASSPWGANIDAKGLGVYLASPKLVETMQGRIAALVASCPATAAPRATPRHLRFVIEHVEADTFDDVDGGTALARVTLRVEQFDDDLAGFSAVRVDGALRAPIAQMPLDDLLVAALDRALASVFHENTAWLGTVTKLGKVQP